MDLSDDELQQRRVTDRREVEAIKVETATWSKASQLDWWVRERREWWVAYAVLTAVNGGSELLILCACR
jgi:hypothetical protein